jgi:hypothetical protein
MTERSRNQCPRDQDPDRFRGGQCPEIEVSLVVPPAGTSKPSLLSAVLYPANFFSIATAAADNWLAAVGVKGG